MAQELVQIRSNWLAIKNGDRDIDHIWNYTLKKVMRILGFWADTEDYPKMSIWWKIWNLFLFPFLFIILWILVCVRVYVDYKILPIPQIAEGISISLGGCISFYAMIRCAQCRSSLSEVIRIADEKYLAVPKNTPTFHEKMRNEYAMEGLITFGACILGGFISIPQALYMLYTGELFYATILPDPEASYKISWWAQFAWQTGIVFYAGIYYSIREIMLVGLFYHIAQLFNVHTESIMELFKDSSMTAVDEERKLKFIVKETSDLLEITEKLTDFMSPILAALGSVVYVILSISGVSILVQSKDTGWISAIGQSIIYPTYVLGVILLWGYIGVLLSDSIEGYDQAMYNCNWVDASPACKTLLKIYKVRFIDPVYVRGGPFFRYNYELVSDILKKSYYLLTLISDRILE